MEMKEQLDIKEEFPGQWERRLAGRVYWRRDETGRKGGEGGCEDRSREGQGEEGGRGKEGLQGKADIMN